MLVAAGGGVAAVIATAIVITVLVVGGDGSSGSDHVPSSGAHGGDGACAWANVGLPVKSVKAPPTKVPTTGTVTVSLTTSHGPMTFTLNRAAAPCTVASFVSLTEQKYFDDSPCHRVTTKNIWVLQCGDPSGSGSGQPGYTVPDEAKGSESYPAGTLAMARFASPDSAGSQFFIVYKDSPDLQRGLGTLQYTVFGTVTSGLPVAQKVGAAGAQTGDDGRPKLPLQLQTVRIR